MDFDLGPSSTRRKSKFAPKGPPRREAQPPKAKSDLADEGDGDDELNEALLRKVNDHLTRRAPKTEKKSSVQVAFTHGVASSTSIRTFGVQKEGTCEISKSKGSRGSTSDDGQVLLSVPSTDDADGVVDNSENAVDPLFKKKKREYKEPWDYHGSYYPTTLPLRRPFPGDPELLDEEEFGKASALEYDESTINSALDLGLLGLEKGDTAKMLFFQLPADIRFGKQATTADRKEDLSSTKLPGDNVPARAKYKAIAGSSTPRGIASRKGKEIDIANGLTSSSTDENTSNKACSLENLQAGYMGKMLVYKSGAVKLKIGDILYDVSPGSDCVFAQDIMVVNTIEEQCCAIGELNKRAIVTPDIDSLLDTFIPDKSILYPLLASLMAEASCFLIECCLATKLVEEDGQISGRLSVRNHKPTS
ncbi:hypothetical protein M9H77_10581 [Catharanthus roseus]|uniref:Uncharacterized protein n=1 Tax=Catharanthus roseus TaxID=4058 RepID=A0ACC0BC49_CATRO|nr:hypothetical protein M9H77_10581 [Catharanthus roseus]